MAKGSGRSRGGSKSNTAGVPSNKKPTGAGGGGGILSAPGVDLGKPGPPITVDPKSSRKAQIQNMKGGDVGKRKGRR